MAGGWIVVCGGDAGYADPAEIFEGVSGFHGCDFAGAGEECAGSAGVCDGGGARRWSRGSPLAEKWDDAAADAIEDLVVAAVRREQQTARRRRPYSSRSGW